MGNCFASDTDSPHAGLAITTDLLSSPAKGSPDSSPGIEVPDVNVDNGKDEIYYDAEHEQPEPSQVSTPSAADFEAFNGGWHQVRTENMNNFLAEMQVPWFVKKMISKVKPFQTIQFTTEGFSVTISGGPRKDLKIGKWHEEFKSTNPRGQVGTALFAYKMTQDGLAISARMETETSVDVGTRRLLPTGEMELMVGPKASAKTPDKTVWMKRIFARNS